MQQAANLAAGIETLFAAGDVRAIHQGPGIACRPEWAAHEWLDEKTRRPRSGKGAAFFFLEMFGIAMVSASSFSDAAIIEA
jgi:hypothetical protein